jgi:hypothetical protein
MQSNMSRSGTRTAKWNTPCELPVHLHRRLNGYALAAGAAGVAVLACSTPAHATPVCKTVDIRLVGTGTYALNPAQQRVPPFNIAETYNNVSSLPGAFWNRGFFIPNWAGAMPLLGANDLPADVHSGASIGPGGNFAKGPSYGMLFTYGPPGSGTFKHHKGNLQLGQFNYIGFRFGEAGESHYGWVRIKVTFKLRTDGKMGVMLLDGYGYETTPNTGIHAGQCSVPEHASETSAKPTQSASLNAAVAADVKGHHDERKAEQIGPSSVAGHASRSATLGLLATGAPGLAIWRREESVDISE